MEKLYISVMWSCFSFTLQTKCTWLLWFLATGQVLRILRHPPTGPLTLLAILHIYCPTLLTGKCVKISQHFTFKGEFCLATCVWTCMCGSHAIRKDAVQEGIDGVWFFFLIWLCHWDATTFGQLLGQTFPEPLLAVGLSYFGLLLFILEQLSVTWLSGPHVIVHKSVWTCWWELYEGK